MARPLRIQYPGAVYQVMCRGDDRKPVFRDDHDRVRFLQILADSCKSYAVVLYCYVLMEKHFHIFLETPRGNLSEFMRQLNITYTSSYNRRHERVGHLFQGRYKSILVEKEAYAAMLSRSIHLNPVNIQAYKQKPRKERARYLKGYPWSTLPGYIDARKRVPFVEYGLILGAYGGDTERGRKAYGDAIRADLAQGREISDKIAAQSMLGGEGFIDSLRRRLRGPVRELPAAQKLRGYTSKKRILQAVADETGVKAKDIVHARGPIRQLAMELLYRHGGLKGPEIGAIFGVDYSTVSQGRKRLKGRMEKDPEFARLMHKIEDHFST
jgi:REP element-mobilizing transposase RayT